MEWGQASKVTDNLIGALYKGHSIYAEHFGALLVAGNNIFPRGKSSIHLNGVMRSSVVGNRFHSFYPGMVRLTGDSSENLFSSNHLLRDNEPWGPMLSYNNGLPDTYGSIIIEGNRNTITSNHISISLKRAMMTPPNCTPVAIRIIKGYENYIAANHCVVTKTADSARNDSCFEPKVSALLSVVDANAMPFIEIMLDDNKDVHDNISVSSVNERD